MDWTNTVLTIVLAFGWVAMLAQLLMLQHRVSIMDQWIGAAIRRIENLEHWIDRLENGSREAIEESRKHSNRQIKETEWTPPTMKHTDIRS
jgi:hypothetical protein